MQCIPSSETRIHSSTMRTARSLPHQGVSLSRGCLYPGRPPGQRPPGRNMEPKTETPRRNMELETETPGKNTGPGSQTGSDIIIEIPPPHRTEWQIRVRTLPRPTSFAGGKNVQRRMLTSIVSHLFKWYSLGRGYLPNPPTPLLWRESLQVNKFKQVSSIGH